MKVQTDNYYRIHIKEHRAQASIYTDKSRKCLLNIMPCKNELYIYSRILKNNHSINKVRLHIIEGKANEKFKNI